MRIIARYITKEVLKAFTVITSILLLVVLSNRFVVYLAKAATGELPAGIVFNIVGLYIPELLSYLIPLGLFIAILFTYGRLYVDSEMTVLMSYGISTQYIVRLTLCIALIIAFLTAGLTLWVVPQVAEIRERALSKGEAFGAMQSLLPGRFQTFSDGSLVFYIEDVTPKQKNLKGVFIAERPKSLFNSDNSDRGWTLISAEEANIKRNANSDDFYLVLNKGYRYQGVPGNADYTVVSFKEYGREIPHVETKPSDTLRLKNSLSLLGSSNHEDIAELQWRLSLPLTVLILALIAVPLARVKPRQGRFAKFLPAVAIYIVYYNLFTISRRWVVSGVLPGFIGVWWVHGLFLLIGLGLIVKETGWLRKTFK